MSIFVLNFRPLDFVPDLYFFPFLLSRIVGAIFIIIHNGLRITEHVMARSHEKHGGGFNMTRYEELNPTDIANRWEVRRSNRAMHVFDEFAGIIGWACVVPVIVIGARILTRGNPTSYVQFAVPMFSFAVLIRLLEWTFNMGQRTGSDWMSSWGSMAVNSGEKGVQLIQVLEVAYELARMRDTWFFAMDWLFIAGGIFCLSLAAKQENLLTRGHYIMGFIIAGLGVLQWIFDLLMVCCFFFFLYRLNSFLLFSSTQLLRIQLLTFFHPRPPPSLSLPFCSP